MWTQLGDYICFDAGNVLRMNAGRLTEEVRPMYLVLPWKYQVDQISDQIQAQEIIQVFIADLRGSKLNISEDWNNEHRMTSSWYRHGGPAVNPKLHA